MRTLERLGLVEEKERLNLPGNPAVYVTTDLFLEKVSDDGYLYDGKTQSFRVTAPATLPAASPAQTGARTTS